MKVAAPALLPILRSQAQGEILAWVFLMPGEHSIAGIARATGIPETTVLREAHRLVTTGFVTERRQGRARLIAPDPNNPATQPLTALLAVTFGPAYVLREQLRAMEGIDLAVIHGTWAARATGITGPPPSAIDLLVVGTVAPAEIDELAETASTALHRLVTATVIDRDTWLAGKEPAVAMVQQHPVITLIDRLETTE